VRPQLFRQLFLTASTSDCDSMEAHVPRKLDAQMSKTADALHREAGFKSKQCRLVA